jgi:hypothetical protein
VGRSARVVDRASLVAARTRVRRGGARRRFAVGGAGSDVAAASAPKSGDRQASLMSCQVTTLPP